MTADFVCVGEGGLNFFFFLNQGIVDRCSNLKFLEVGPDFAHFVWQVMNFLTELTVRVLYLSGILARCCTLLPELEVGWGVLEGHIFI